MFVYFLTIDKLNHNINRVWSGGAPASEAKSCRHSKAESQERSEHSAGGPGPA